MTADYAEELGEVGTVDDLAGLCARHIAPPVVSSVNGVDQRNALRGLLAAHGLVPYVQRCGSGNDEIEVQLSDLVCDLRHLADSLDIDWTSVEDRVNSNYAAEASGG